MKKLHFFQGLRFIRLVNERRKNNETLTHEDQASFIKEKVKDMEIKFMECLNKEKTKTLFPLVTVKMFLISLRKVFMREVLLILLYMFISLVSKTIFAYFLFQMLNVQNIKEEISIYWAFGLFGSILINVYAFHHSNSINVKLTIFIKDTMISTIYSKICRISLYNIHQSNIGKLINIVANDLNDMKPSETYHILLALLNPFGYIFSVVLNWYIIGWYCIIGYAFMIILIPIKMLINNMSELDRKMKNIYSDMRLTNFTSAIAGIRTVKMYGWEDKIESNINRHRFNEMYYLRKIIISDLLIKAIAVHSHLMAAVLTFSIHTLIEKEILSSAQVFSTLFMYSYVRKKLLFNVSVFLKVFAELKLTMKRTIEILNFFETEPYEKEETKEKDNAIEVENYNSMWGNSDQDQENSKILNEKSRLISEKKFSLINVNINIKRGTLNLIFGKSGSGKTSFLHMFLNEMIGMTGTIRTIGKYAFVEQEPIIFSGTLRENICIGKEYNENKFIQITKACYLENDFKKFPYLEDSEIGESGVNLSSGQRARIALARAVYSEADIYFLDNPFAAVNSKLISKIFKSVIKGLLVNKTIIMATHHTQFANDADYIIFLENKSILKVEESKRIKSIEKKVLILSSINLELNSNDNEENIEIESVKSIGIENPVFPNSFSKNDFYKPEITLKEIKVSLEDYKLFFAGFKPIPLAILMLLSFAFSVTLDIYVSKILADWSNKKMESSFAFSLAFPLSILSFILHLLKAVIFSFLSMNSAEMIHSKALHSVLRAKIIFFNKNPAGRIVNRFSNDQGVIDKNLSQIIFDIVNSFFLFISIFVAVIAAEPIIILVGLAQLCICLLILRKFFMAITEGRFLELITRSPIYSQILETLEGIILIRAYCQENRFITKMRFMIDLNGAALRSFWRASRLFAFLVDYISAISNIISIAIVFNYGASDPGKSGLISYLLLQIGEFLQVVLFQVIVFNISMTSTVRLAEYSNIPSEVETIESKMKTRKRLIFDPEISLKGKWPAKGEIEFKDVRLFFGNDYIIKGISFKIYPCERIGCVGNSGAGKSTILDLIFRMHNKTSGTIKIDDVDIDDIPLNVLRSKISVIPSTPFIFEGSIRKNIDPFDQYTREEIIKALIEVELFERINSFDQGMDTIINNKLSVLSVGEKQLMCLARAIMSNNKILILDEATSQIDLETDRLIQKMIKEKFKDATVFCIAHRLSTVAAYDKILVINNGLIEEFSEPFKLLTLSINDQEITNTNGRFSKMVIESGRKSADSIFLTSRYHYFRKYLNN